MRCRVKSCLSSWGRRKEREVRRTKGGRNKKRILDREAIYLNFKKESFFCDPTQSFVQGKEKELGSKCLHEIKRATSH